MSITPKISMSTFGEVKIEAPPPKRFNTKDFPLPVVVKWQSGTDVVVIHSGDMHVSMHVGQLASLVELAPQILPSASSATQVTHC